MTNNNLNFTEFVSMVFGEHAFSKGNINIVCPICLKGKDSTYSKKKLAIKLDNHLVHCWVCGYKSHNLVHLLKEYRNSKEYLSLYLSKFLPKGSFGGSRSLSVSFDDELLEIHQDKKVELPNDFQLLAPIFEGKIEIENSWIVNRCFAYLKKRGLLNLRNLWYWKFGISTGEEHKEFWNRIIVPSFDENGELNYWTSRAIDSKLFPKYHNPDVPRRNIIFNEVNINWSEELILVEGPFDLFKCPDNATCILGSEVTSEFKLFQKIAENKTPVVIAFDPDAKKKTIRFAKLLEEYSIPVKFIDIPSTFEDVGAMSKKQFIEIMNKHTINFDRNDLLSHKIKSLTL